MQILNTIIPIFSLIGLGWFARQKGFIPPEFLGPANRLTYYFAIPAMVFRAISRASIVKEFHGRVLLATLAAAALAYLIAWLYCLLRRVPPQRAGGVIQCAAHGNLGYIGLPLAFYFLGDSGFVKAGILSGFLMILQNVLSVSAMQSFSRRRGGEGGLSSLLLKLFSNPVIVGSLAGIAVSGLGISFPKVLERSLDMLGSLAPPMSLLLIGAAISLQAVKQQLRGVSISVLIKLLILPTIGLSLFHLLSLETNEYLPGMILLCSPTATIAYLMAKEMAGDTEFVASAISISTLCSAVTFSFWLTLVFS